MYCLKNSNIPIDNYRSTQTNYLKYIFTSIVRKPRAIIFRFRDFRARPSLFYNKKMLKGTGISITENLTKKRYTLYKHAVAKYGLGEIWTIERRVTTKIDNKIFVIKSDDDLA